MSLQEGDVELQSQYPYIIADVLRYIEIVKGSGDTISSLIDIIMDYCEKNSASVDVVGDAIQSDVYFKSFIEKDCQLHNIFRSPTEDIGVW